MKTKFSGILTLLLAFVVQVSFAQTTVSGTVTEENGPLPGANVIVKGTSNGTQTDFDGNYSIQASPTDVLVFSFVGFTTKEVTVGNQTTINVSLATDNALDEVIVTAQGIKREKKALGYAVSTISAEEIGDQAQTDVVRALTGKAPGVNITQTSGISGTGTNIIIRGYSSINGSNQPLFVVDGVPFNSDANSTQDFTQGGAAASSRFLDIDPNNISSISVLKGLSATTLYGQAGRNGVVLVTTKSGSAQGGLNQKFEITVNQSYFANEISDLPDYQNSYGNGFQQFYSPAFSNWGPSFNQRVDGDGVNADGTVTHPLDRPALAGIFPEFQGAEYEYRPYNNVEPFFRTGSVIATSASISAGNEQGAYNVSFGRTDDEGFIPGNNYRRLNFSAGGNAKLSNNFTVSSSFNYVITDTKTPPLAAGFGSNPTGGTSSVFANVLYTPRSIDLFGLPFENPVDNSMVYYRGDDAIQNPRWTLKNATRTDETRRFFGNITTVYDVNNWLNLSYRVSLDSYDQIVNESINKGGASSQVPLGRLSTLGVRNTVWDHTLSANFDTPIGEKFSLNGSIGVNPRGEYQDFTSTVSTDQFVYGVINHQNFIDTDAASGTNNFNILGTYASATLDYENFVFVNVAGRNDWFSSLPKETRSQFYPSASISFVPTTAFEGLKASENINFLKLRFGYGSSAGFPSAYSTQIGLASAANAFINPNGGETINTLSNSNRLGNVNLKPELITELEAGIEARFFKNRLGFDLSVYDKISEDLILQNRQLDPSTGNTVTASNVAEVSNKGLELGFNFTPIKNSTPDGFRWDISGQYTINENIVESLGGDSEVEIIAGFTTLGNAAIPGQAYGVIYGIDYARDENGNRLITGAGDYVAASSPSIIGDPNADWRITGISNFSYKNFGLRMQWEYTHGGDIYSTTIGSLLARGLTTDTDFDRNQGYILEGVTADGQPNTTQITATNLFFNNIGVASAGGINARGIYDASVVRLREVSLSYNFPESLLKNTPFGRISLSLIGQNLFYHAPNTPDGINFDPEVSSTGVGNGQGFDYLTGPTSKRYGFTLNATF